MYLYIGGLLGMAIVLIGLYVKAKLIDRSLPYYIIGMLFNGYSNFVILVNLTDIEKTKIRNVFNRSDFAPGSYEEE